MENMKPYKTYKPSGIAWLGDIPEHWQQTQLNKLFQDNKAKNEDLSENNLLTLSYGKIKRKDINSANGLLPASFSNYQIVEKGDIVLRLLDLQNDKNSLRVGYVNEKGIITSAYIGLKIKNDNSSKYFYTLLNHLDLIKHFYNGGGGVRQSLGFAELGKERLPVPTKSEQTAIANFLDYKLAKIDRFIRKKKQLIKLLNEQKAGIINHAVTKGINPNVTTKPSGIQWLGDIPEHWEIVKLRYLVKITTGNRNTEDKVEDGLYDFFVRSKKVEKINSYSFEGEGILTAGDGVGVGKVFHYINGKCDYHQRVYLFYSFAISIFPKFLFYFLQEFLKNELMIYNAKSTVDSVRLPVLKDFLVVLPSISEQKSIVAHIETETAKLNQTITTIEKEILLVQEYRTALIAEAVTGKIDVRDYQIPSFEVEDNYEEIEEALNIAAEDEVEYEKQDAE